MTTSLLLNARKFFQSEAIRIAGFAILNVMLIVYRYEFRHDGAFFMILGLLMFTVGIIFPFIRDPHPFGQRTRIMKILTVVSGIVFLLVRYLP